MPYKFNESRRHKIPKAKYQVTNWPESNGPFNFSAPFLTGIANSDVDVPEPASCGLIALGIGALIGRRRT